jgi:hypothetical protein
MAYGYPPRHHAPRYDPRYPEPPHHRKERGRFHDRRGGYRPY